LIGVTLGCDLEEVGIELLPRVIGMGEKREAKALSLPGDNLLPRGDQTFKLLLPHHVGEVPGRGGCQKFSIEKLDTRRIL
jgi:hypothetical protein